MDTLSTSGHAEFCQSLKGVAPVQNNGAEHDSSPPCPADLVAAIAAVPSPRWVGTATNLAALLPAEMRPSNPAVFSKLLRNSVAELAAAGVIAEGKRQPKTGRRLITLTRQPENRQPEAPTPPAPLPVNNSPITGPAASPARPFENAQPCRRRAINRLAAARAAMAKAVKQTGNNQADALLGTRETPGDGVPPDQAGEFSQPDTRTHAEGALAGIGQNQPDYGESYARAPARIPPQTPHPAIRYQVDGAPMPEGAYCSNCGSARWWWCGDVRFWACGTCNPPTVLPGQTQPRWQRTCD